MKNDKRAIFGWAMYDWANSAYSTVVAGAVLPAFFAGVIVPEDGWHGMDGQTIWSYTTGYAALVLFLFMPVLGAIADYSAKKRKFLTTFAVFGSIFSVLLVFAVPGAVGLTLSIFFLAQFGFVAGNVFYDGFLPDISTDDTIDKVSSKGYAIGYVGGGVYLVMAVGLIFAAESLGVDETLMTRIAISGAGLWWLLFSLFAIKRLPETGEALEIPAEYAGRSKVSAYARIGFGRTVNTTRKLRQFPQLLLFVVAFILYNDGVQTVIGIAGVYATDTLELSILDITLAYIIVQFVAWGGASLFGRLSYVMGIKPAIQLSLVIWILVTTGAYFMPAGELTPFLVVAVVIGIVLGGTQALSRSLYGSMIPEAASAEFFGFFTVFSKFSAIWGPIIFATFSRATGSGRQGILSLIIFFIIGAILLSKVDIEEARASRDRWDMAELDA